MKAIRGATTISADTPEEIKSAVKELLREMVSVNNISDDRIVFILLSNTADIKSMYPAKAAREAGFSVCPLYSSSEPCIDGSLPMCIRVMLLVEFEQQIKHVYLRGASVLRKDLSDIVNIAVDGPAGSGKSTVCKLVAKKLNILYLDTGAMYRAIALHCVRSGADYAEKESVEHVLDGCDLKIEYRDGRQCTLLNGVDVSGEIRTPQISLVASYISAYGFVRKRMVELQRKIAVKTSCILDGRDIGTNVLPDCRYKFYLTASADVRALRRYEEDKAKGGSQTFEQVLADINERDFQDKNRAVAPLKQALDACVIDTTSMSIDEVVDEIICKIQEKV